MNNTIHRALAISLLLVGLAAAVPAMQITGSPSSQSSWLEFANCSVMVEHSVDVPALESGVLQLLDVELNDSVTQGTVIAKLDTEMADLDLQLAVLQGDAASELAKDSSRIQFNELVLRETEDELTTFQSIGSVVSEAEIRRLRLEVAKASLTLLQSKQAQVQAQIQAQLMSATAVAAQHRLKRRSVSAPLSGIVNAILLQPGQWVEAGQPIVRIRNFETMLVDHVIPARQVNLTSIEGAEVRVDATGHDGKMLRLSGKVSSYDREVSTQGLIRIHARVTNTQQGGQWVLKHGDIVKLHIAAEHFHPLQSNVK